MTNDELLAMPDNTLVLLADAKTGMLIAYPFAHVAEALIQVPGEREARKVLPAALTRYGNSLLEGDKRRPHAGFDFDKYVANLYMLGAMSATAGETPT